MQIRRYNSDTFFDFIEESKVLKSEKKIHYKFICIPRYNCCINLRPISINFFFNHIYKIRTAKTYFIWSMLLLATVWKGFSFILKKIGLDNVIESRNSTFSWNKVDVIYIEWHFYGLFCSSERTVTHLLTSKAYYSRFRNEINARSLAKKHSEVFPKMIKVNPKEPFYYTEELSVDKNNHFISNDDLILAERILIEINEDTLKIENLESYYNYLIENIGYIKHNSINNHLQLLKRKVEKFIHSDAKIELALVHGDFNIGQILKKDKNIKVVDWGDGGVHNRFFDFITINLNNNPNIEFSTDNFPKEYKALNKYFNSKLSKIESINLYVLISLLEVLNVSRDEFILEKGAWGRWQNAVSMQCNLLE